MNKQSDPCKPENVGQTNCRRWRQFHGQGLLFFVILMVANPVNLSILADNGDVCDKTANDVLTSCRSSAQSEYQVTLGKCLNITDQAGRKDCETEAKHELSDALQTCQQGHAVRAAACEKLGDGAYDPIIDPTHFVTIVDNPYFPLTPGTTYIFEGKTSSSSMKDVFAVTNNTRVIDGVTCVEVHDSVFTDGELSEDTLDWFAQDIEGNVWYFGENTQELENGLITTIEGTFMAGVNHDKPGIVMKAHPAIGDFYRQEYSLGNAEDFAETLSLKETVVVPAGTFTNCLKSQETTPLEPDALEDKFYAPGVGNVLTIDETAGERCELVRIVKQ